MLDIWKWFFPLPSVHLKLLWFTYSYVLIVLFCQSLDCNDIRQAIDLLDGLIPGGEESKDIPKDHMERLIVFAIMWSLGALLELADRKKVTISGSCGCLFPAAKVARKCASILLSFHYTCTPQQINKLGNELLRGLQYVKGQFETSFVILTLTAVSHLAFLK